MDEEPSGGAPPVVAVVVTRDPGPWLEEALSALDGQDYPNLSVLVIDAASADDPTPRVAAVAPSAFVRRVADPRGFAGGANEVLTVVEGASHFLFCHDDVAPDASALRELVEEAFRSNAGVVGPKLVTWDHEDQLLGVGLAVDKLATSHELVERLELDQEQHDAVRDVFAVPSACVLVRADLFTSLGGFTAVLADQGEDVDLCWRAQIAGARVVFCPSARVRHLEAGHRGRRATRPDTSIEDRNRLHTILTCYGIIHLLRVLPQAAVLSALETILALVTGDFRRARTVVSAWTWNLRRVGELRHERKRVHKIRALHDGEVRRLQSHGSARLSAFLRAQAAGDGAGRSVASVSRDLAGSFRQGSLRLPVTVWTVGIVLLAVGSRHLLGEGVPTVGQLAPFPDSPGTFLRLFLSGWRTPGLGSAAAAPPAFAFLGLGGSVLLGATGLLRSILILGAVPVGTVGAYRLARPFGGRHARLAAMVLYLAVPVPYDALARGRWAGLLTYAAAPYILRRILAASGVEPFVDERKLQHQLLPLGLLLAVLAAFVPSTLLLVPMLAVGVVLGSLLVGQVQQSLRSLTVAAGAAVVAILLLVPWSLDLLLPGGEWASFTGVARPLAQAPSLGDLLRFDTGPIGSAPLGWGFLIAAALPLLIGRQWRLAWAVRLWTVAIVCWAVAWAGGRGWLGLPIPPPEVLLAPAAAALALSLGLGVVAFFVDLPGYSFGVRQVVTLVAAAAVALGSVPTLAAVPDGRWRMASTDDAHLLAWMPAEQESGSFRVLWVGSPDVLPLDGWRLAPGVAYATSRNGPPDATDLLPPASDGATELLGRALDVARRGRTTRLGHLLAPMGVRYLVLPTRPAPGAKGQFTARPVDVTAALQGQLDLKQVPSDSSVLLYENVAWAPTRSVLPADAVDPSRSRQPESAGTVELAGADPVLGKSNSVQSFSGPLADGQRVLFSEAASSDWALTIGGHDVARSRAFGWANAYDVSRSGRATLEYRTPSSRWLALLVELVLWVLAVGGIISTRRRRQAPAGGAGTGGATVLGLRPDPEPSGPDAPASPAEPPAGDGAGVPADPAPAVTATTVTTATTATTTTGSGDG